MRVNQINHLKQLEGAGKVFPHKFHVSISMSEFTDKYSKLANEEVSEDVVSLAGKIKKKTF